MLLSSHQSHAYTDSGLLQLDFEDESDDDDRSAQSADGDDGEDTDDGSSEDKANEDRPDDKLEGALEQLQISDEPQIPVVSGIGA